MDPAEQVLSTTELLEIILLYVDPRTVLTSAQRVSRRWRALVTESPALQGALFLRPDPNHQRHYHQHQQMAARVGTPLVNPFLTRDFWAPMDALLLGDGSREPPWWVRGRPARDPRFMRRGASWRRMLARRERPAARVLGICARFWTLAGDTYSRTSRELGYSTLVCEYADGDDAGGDGYANSGGVRMCHLIEAIRNPDGGRCGAQWRLMGVLRSAESGGGSLRAAVHRSMYHWEPSAEAQARFEEVGRVADIVLAKEIQADALGRHYARPRDVLMMRADWDRDFGDPEPLRCTEWNEPGVERWFDEQRIGALSAAESRTEV